MIRLIEWKQTAAERYDTDVNERARKAVEGIGIKVIGNWGGCAFGEFVGSDLPAEEGLEAEGTAEQFARVPDALRFILGNPETLVIREDDLAVTDG